VNDVRALAVRGGVREEEAIALLRQFYATENQSAPMPQKRTRKQLELAAETRAHGQGDDAAKSNT
jgi:tRNA-specific adenosine deaminase 2